MITAATITAAPSRRPCRAVAVVRSRTVAPSVPASDLLLVAVAVDKVPGARNLMPQACDQHHGKRCDVFGRMAVWWRVEATITAVGLMLAAASVAWADAELTSNLVDEGWLRMHRTGQADLALTNRESTDYPNTTAAVDLQPVEAV
jgi:hypothetical protein